MVGDCKIRYLVLICRIFLSLGSVAFAQEVLQDILNSIQSQNVDAIIAEAERILEEIKSRDFMLDERAANDEYGLANESKYSDLHINLGFR